MRIELRGITKSFGNKLANDRIDLTVESGTIHGLLGENGAGKSTLMKALAGFQPADAGEIILDGSPATLHDPADAVAAGIGMLYQEPLDLPNLTVIENFQYGRRGRLDLEAAAAELQSLAARFDFAFDPEVPVSTLSIGERQQLELCRLLALGVRVLILDEPTTAISAQQQAKLFDALRRLAAEGKTVLFVTHKLAEAQSLCGQVTVLAGGRVTGTTALPCPTAHLVRLMFGRELSHPARDAAPARRTPLLELDRLTVADRHLEVSQFSLTVGEGEIIGFAGLEGSGQRLVLRAIAGLHRPRAGRIALGGTELTGRPYPAFLDAGIAYLPADRLGEGLIAGLTITEHQALRRRRHPFRVDWRAEAAQAAACVRDYRVLGTPESRIGELSGGNQQRTMLGLLDDGLQLLLLEHPTRGLDLASALELWDRLRDRCRAGAAVVFASADLDELREHSDRIVVFCAGKTAVLDAREATVERLGALIGGEGMT